MDYTINCLITGEDFDALDARTHAALSAHGFGILTEIDVKATMKKKLDVEMTLEAIGMEPRVGTMPPCKVILREELGAVEPVA